MTLCRHERGIKLPMSYTTLRGSSALLDFRRKVLLKKLNINQVQAQWIHYVAFHGDDGPPNSVKNDLEAILTYGDEYVEEDKNGENTTTWFVQPRQGTISPWSSKATSIAEVCGLTCIHRIERGTMIKIWPDGQFDNEKAKKELHDPMTQDLTTTIPSLEAMFEE